MVVMMLRALSFALLCAAAAPAARAAPAAAAPAPAAAAQGDPVGAHAAIAQAQERLAEIDASITALQGDVEKLDAAGRQQAHDAVETLRTLRDTYRKEIDAVAAEGRQMTVEQLRLARATLTAPWTQFEQTLDRDVASLKLDVAQRKALIEARVKAEQAYWQKVLADLQAAAASLTAEQRAAIDARIAGVRTRVDEAGARLTRLGTATRTAWSALKQGFTNTRRTFADVYRGTP